MPDVFCGGNVRRVGVKKREIELSSGGTRMMDRRRRHLVEARFGGEEKSNGWRPSKGYQQSERNAATKEGAELVRQETGGEEAKKAGRNLRRSEKRENN